MIVFNCMFKHSREIQGKCWIQGKVSINVIYIYIYTHTCVYICIHTYHTPYPIPHTPYPIPHTPYPIPYNAYNAYHAYIHTYIHTYINTYIHISFACRATSADAESEVEWCQCGQARAKGCVKRQTVGDILLRGHL